MQNNFPIPQSEINDEVSLYKSSKHCGLEKMRAAMWLTVLLVTLMGHEPTAAVEFAECASAPEMGIYVASSSNCSKYIYCAGPGSFEAECLAGHYYDEDLDRCVDRELVKRCQDPLTSKSPSVVKKPQPPAMATQTTEPLAITLRLLPNAGPCYPYMVCFEGAGLTSACTPAHLVSCNRRQSPEIITQCQSGVYGFMPHPRNCAYFYYCSSGSKHIHRCPLNYTWHYERRSCVQQSEKKCFSERIRLVKKKQP
ncbi:uncharacterized protein LOC108148720 [Drosophila elegans]|uniref:uncharacterized protein LOC108148720 n=1 Tax=Drosophila elegans TaxID=30023 RepID=UPI001BC8323B|nr:uncharacterized protein LOC108148720 [Drosophila elegans]